MGDTVHVEAPTGCAAAELRSFEHLVRAGFGGSDATLARRIRDAHRLAFRTAADGELVAIAGLKSPGEGYRAAVFDRAAAGVDPADYELELGWVFVLPAHRGRRVAASLCRLLLDGVPGAPVFATTRPDNAPMIRILETLGFSRVGDAYLRPSRREELVLFLRPGRDAGTAAGAGREIS